MHFSRCLCELFIWEIIIFWGFYDLAAASVRYSWSDLVLWLKLGQFMPGIFSWGSFLFDLVLEVSCHDIFGLCLLGDGLLVSLQPPVGMTFSSYSLGPVIGSWALNWDLNWDLNWYINWCKITESIFSFIWNFWILDLLPLFPHFYCSKAVFGSARFDTPLIVRFILLGI